MSLPQHIITNTQLVVMVITSDGGNDVFRVTIYIILCIYKLS